MLCDFQEFLNVVRIDSHIKVGRGDSSFYLVYSFLGEGIDV